MSSLLKKVARSFALWMAGLDRETEEGCHRGLATADMRNDMPAAVEYSKGAKVAGESARKWEALAERLRVAKAEPSVPVSALRALQTEWVDHSAVNLYAPPSERLSGIDEGRLQCADEIEALCAEAERGGK